MNSEIQNLKSDVSDPQSATFVVFTLDSHRFALPLASVERVVRAVAVTHVPKAPDIVIGIVNMQGMVIPVVDIRRRFRLPEREIYLSDQLIISRTSRRLIGIVVDAVCGVVECHEQKIVTVDEILPGIGYVKGVGKLEDGMVLIHDIDGFLSLEEEKTLDDACREI